MHFLPQRKKLNHYSEIFREDFKARPQGHTSDDTYYNLKDFVHRGFAHLDILSSIHAFVNTTSNGSVNSLIHYQYLLDLFYKSRARSLTLSKSTCSFHCTKGKESQKAVDRGTKPRNY